MCSILFSLHSCVKYQTATYELLRMIKNPRKNTSTYLAYALLSSVYVNCTKKENIHMYIGMLERALKIRAIKVEAT